MPKVVFSAKHRIGMEIFHYKARESEKSVFHTGRTLIDYEDSIQKRMNLEKVNRSFAIHNEVTSGKRTQKKHIVSAGIKK